MVTILNSTEFENIWNTIVNIEDFDADYAETHWACGQRFFLDEIEANKPDGWRKLKEVINDVERTCVVYYYCKINESCEDAKDLFFVVFGENAQYNCMKIRACCNILREKETDLTAEECLNSLKNDGVRSGEIEGSVTAQCPLF